MKKTTKIISKKNASHVSTTANEANIDDNFRHTPLANWAKKVVTANWYEQLNIIVTYIAIFCEPLGYLFVIYLGIHDTDRVLISLVTILLLSSLVFLIDIILWVMATGPKYFLTPAGIINVLAIGGTMVDIFAHQLGILNPRVLRILRTVRVVSKVSLAQRVKSGMTVLGSKINSEMSRADLWFSLAFLLIFALMIGGFNFGVYSSPIDAYKELGFYIGIILMIFWKNRTNKAVIREGLDKKIQQQNDLMLAQMSNIPGLSNAEAILDEEQKKSLKKGIQIDELGLMVLAVRSIINTLRRFISRRTFSEAKGEIILPANHPVSIIFTDVIDFAKIVEAMSTDVVPVLTHYFEEVVGTIRKHGGDIDKFIGDAIFAFFHDIKNADDATNQAFDAVCKLHELFEHKFVNDKAWASLFAKDPAWEGFRVMRTRYGLHYGVVTAGPVGSKQRADSTLIGDTVNTTARLEALCKKYGLYLLMSDDFVGALSSDRRAKCCRIDVVSVAGREALPHDIYTVDFQHKPKAFWDEYSKGLQLKIDGAWQGAYDAFARAQQILLDAKMPEDPTVNMMVAHIAETNQDWKEAMALLSAKCPQIFTKKVATDIDVYFQKQAFKAPDDWPGFWVHGK